MRRVGLLGLCTVAVLGGFASAVGCSSSSSDTTTTPPKDSGMKEDTSTGTGPMDAGQSDVKTVTLDAHVVDAHVGLDATTPVPDANAPEVSTVPMDAPMTDHDAAAKTDAVSTGLPDGSAPAAHALITFGGASTSETVVINLASKAIEGRIPFAGSGITDTRNTLSPFLLEQSADIVAKLDSTKPWIVDSSWNVALMDALDGGSFNSQPMQVVVETGTKAYVLRYQRNDIAVINESVVTEAGAPTSSISLASYLQTGDTDGVVEMTAAAYVPSTNRLYVVLANINQVEAAAYQGSTICDGQTSTVIAINTLTDTLVNLGGTGPGGSIPLMYYDPVTAVYDAVGDRLIVVSGGCYAKPTGDAAVGTPTLRGIEAVSLSTNKSTSLLALSPSPFPAGFVDLPTSFAYIDSTHAIIGFDSTGQAVYSWDPTMTKLGAVIPNAPDVFVYDGNGHLVGTRYDVSDAGVGATHVVSVTEPAGVSTTLGTNVTSLTGSPYVSSVDVWPHP